MQTSQVTGHAQRRGGLPDLLRRLEQLDAVGGPQLADGLAAPGAVRFVPDRHVAVDELLEVGHGFSSMSWWIHAANAS
jgi:hypothetical protein